MHWTDIVSAVATSLGVLVAGALSFFIYRLGKKDTAEQRREEREYAKRQRAYEGVGRLYRQVFRGVEQPGDHKRLNDAIAEFLTYLPDLAAIPREHKGQVAKVLRGVAAWMEEAYRLDLNYAANRETVNEKLATVASDVLKLLMTSGPYGELEVHHHAAREQEVEPGSA